MPQLTEPENLPPIPPADPNWRPREAAGATLRQTVRASIGGSLLRLRLSNEFGGAPLPVTGVSVALPRGGRAGARAIRAGSARPVTFHGHPSVVVPAGAPMLSDPVPFDLPPRANLTVTMYLAEGLPAAGLTSHPGSRTTSHLLPGSHVDDRDLPGATPVEHWYLLSGVEVLAGPATQAIVMLGDSLTDGRGSTVDGNDRWPDRLLDRLHAHPGTRGVAVLNQAAGGNRVLNDGLGPSVLARLDRDVLAPSGVRWLFVFEGVNDIGTAPPTEAGQKQVAADLIGGYEQIVERAHARGIAVYGATILPFGGNDQYDDPDGGREAARQTVNEWIRAAGRFDAVVDFDAVARDPACPSALLPAYHDGDCMHLNPAGYRALADAVPLDLFG